MKTISRIRILITSITLFFILVPLLVTIPASFTTETYPSFPPHGFSFEWYTKLLDRPEFIQGFINSVIFATISALLSMVLGTLSALAISKYDLPGKSYFISLLTSPLTVPQLVLGIALLIYFVPLMLSGTMIGFIIAHIIICVPYVIRYVLTGLTGFDYTLERAALILGAHPIKVFWKVTMPLIRPAILSGGLFAFLISFDNVTVSLFLVSPDMKTLPIEIFSYMQASYDPLVASVSSVVIFISIVLIVILEKLQGVGKLFGGTH